MAMIQRTHIANIEPQMTRGRRFCVSRRWMPIQKIGITAALLMTVFLTGCGSTPVVQDVTQKQAHEIVAVLVANGIEATVIKETGGGARYTVETSRDNYSRAISLMHDKGLPGEEQLSFQDLVAQRGLVPVSRAMEALRIDRALAIDIEEALKEIPSIASSRVIVRQNVLRAAAGEFVGEKPGVSVVVQQRPGQKINNNDIAQLVLRVVPGIEADRILVLKEEPLLEEAVTSGDGAQGSGASQLTGFLWFWRVPRSEYAGIALVFCSVLLLGLCVGWYLGSGLLRYRLGKQGWHSDNHNIGIKSQVTKGVHPTNRVAQKDLLVD